MGDTNPQWVLLLVFALDICSINGRVTIDRINCNNNSIITSNKTEKLIENFIEIADGNGSLSVVTQQPAESSTTQRTVTHEQEIHSNRTKNNIAIIRRINSCKCGIASSGSGKIVGGTLVNENDFWPWFATLVRIDRSTKVHCGASLISRRYVLTAAHCILPMIQLGLRNFRVKLGYNELFENNVSMALNKQHEQFNVPIESATVHPQYEQSFPYHYDIGVVKLSYSINCSNRVRPICLPSVERNDNENTDYNNETVITLGFGRTSINGNQSRVLQQIQLKLISMSECRHNFSKLWYKAPDLLDNMICAWSKGKDTCVGDSGGPLFLWRKATNNATVLGRSETSSYFEQVGVTSWGIGCANDRYPGVYSKVNKFLPWLQSVVNYDMS